MQAITVPLARLDELNNNYSEDEDEDNIDEALVATGISSYSHHSFPNSQSHYPIYHPHDIYEPQPAASSAKSSFYSKMTKKRRVSTRLSFYSMFRERRVPKRIRANRGLPRKPGSLDKLREIYHICSMSRIFGFTLFAFSEFERKVGIGTTILGFAANIFQFIHSCVMLYLAEDKIYAILWASQSIYSLILRIYLQKNAKAIRKCLALTLEKCDLTQGHLRTKALICEILALLAMFADFVRLVTWFWYKPEQILEPYENLYLQMSFLQHIPMQLYALIDFITYAYATIGWLISTKMFYYYAFYLSNRCFENFYTHVHRNTRDCRRLTTIRRDYHHLYNLKQQLNGALSLLPLVWYSQLFFETSSQILRNTRKLFRCSGTDFLFDWGSFIILLIFTITITYMIDNLTNRESDLIERIIQILSRKEPINLFKNSLYQLQKHTFLLEITKYPTVFPDAFGTFQINRCLILGFFGAVIPFSVMCLEMRQILDIDAPEAEKNLTDIC